MGKIASFSKSVLFDGFSFNFLGVKVVVTYFIVVLFLLLSAWSIQAGFMYFVIFSTVFLHEFGHILTARFFGYQTRRVLLFFLGGLAEIAMNESSNNERLWISIGGPMVNVVIVLISVVAFLMAQIFTIPILASIALPIMAINIVLLLFNLLPIYPLDGGRILFGIFRNFLSLKSTIKAMHHIGIIFTITGIIFFLFVAFSPVGLIVMSFLAINTRKIMDAEMEEELGKIV